jgi:hypothetical protein
MTAPTVEAAIHELMDFAWNVVNDLLGDGLFVEEYIGIDPWRAFPVESDQDPATLTKG